MDVSVQHDNEGRQTFVGVLVPADGQGDPREVDLPTNHSAYREAVAQLLGTQQIHLQWPKACAKKAVGPHLVTDVMWRDHNTTLNSRATALIKWRMRPGSESTLKKMYGPVVFCTGDSIDEPFRDVTLATYWDYFDRGMQGHGEDGLTVLLREALIRGTAADGDPEADAASGGLGAALPLVYKPGEWAFNQPPKALISEYQQKHLEQPLHFHVSASSPSGPFLCSVTVPDLGLKFTPNATHASRSKKEAEHQAALLVLQHLGGSPMCGTALSTADSRDGGNSASPDGEWTDVHGDGGIMKKLVKEGSGDIASAGWVTVHYVCQMIDPSDPTRLTPFESTRDGQQTLPKSFQLHSEDEMCEVVQGLHDAVATMRQQEVAQFKIGPEYAYRMGIPDLIPANATFLYEVELLSKTQERPEIEVRDHAADAAVAKVDGNLCYQHKQYKAAQRCYHLGLQSLDKVKSPAEDELEELNRLFALEVSPEATKAFYRRAQAHMGMNDFDLAQQDLERVLGLASDDAAIQRDVRAQLKALDLKRRQHDQRMGQMYARMLRDDA